MYTKPIPSTTTKTEVTLLHCCFRRTWRSIWSVFWACWCWKSGRRMTAPQPEQEENYYFWGSRHATRSYCCNDTIKWPEQWKKFPAACTQLDERCGKTAKISKWGDATQDVSKPNFCAWRLKSSERGMWMATEKICRSCRRPWHLVRQKHQNYAKFSKISMADSPNQNFSENRVAKKAISGIFKKLLNFLHSFAILCSNCAYSTLTFSPINWEWQVQSSSNFHRKTSRSNVLHWHINLVRLPKFDFSAFYG